MELSILINKFNIKGRLVSLQPFGNGNINDTFLAIYRNTFSETQVILQRVNKNVFPQPEVIMENMHEITKHCHEKLEDDAQKGRDDRVWQMPRIIKAKDSKDYVVDDKGDVWRVITRIMSAHALCPRTPSTSRRALSTRWSAARRWGTSTTSSATWTRRR